MALKVWTAGEPVLSADLNGNFILDNHGNPILPRNSAHAGVNNAIDLGSSSYKLRSGYFQTGIYLGSGSTTRAIGGITDKMSIVTIKCEHTSISFYDTHFEDGHPFSAVSSSTHLTAPYPTNAWVSDAIDTSSYFTDQPRLIGLYPVPAGPTNNTSDEPNGDLKLASLFENVSYNSPNTTVKFFMIAWGSSVTNFYNVYYTFIGTAV